MIVVGLAGPAGAGKSTAARHLVVRHGFVRRPFAGILKEMLRTLLMTQGASAGEVERMVDGDRKEVPSFYLGGRTPRHAMQTLGTEWGRALASDLWVDAWRASLAGLDRVVADDVRFANEVAAVRSFGGLVIVLRRPDLTPVACTHASEAGVAGDLTITNGSGVSCLVRALELALGC